MTDQTPMMKQYLQIKNKYNDCILFYRLGDFYEMFNDDAIIASRELELVLTGRGGKKGDKIGGDGPSFAHQGCISKCLCGEGEHFLSGCR